VTIVGAAPHIASATRIPIRILREDIHALFNCDRSQETLQMAKKVPPFARKNFHPLLRSLGIYPERRYFLGSYPHSTASGARMAERHHNFLREGIITGFIGATAIALWFLVVDTVSGRPFYTPIFLGKGVVSVLGKNMMGDTAFTQVLGYTIFHYAAFFIVGILLTVIVHQAERTPGILAGLLVAIVVMSLGFYMIAAAFAQSALGRLAWPQIFIANLIAAVLMLGYLWRTHPRLDHQLKQALEGTDD
jgi:hypothetical protein